MLGLSIGLDAPFPLPLNIAPPAVPGSVTILGDSITSTAENQPGNRGDFYSYDYADDPANANFVLHVRAQASRTVGGGFWSGPPAEGADNGSPAGNTLLNHRAQIIADNPDLVTVMIGANDLGSYSVGNYLARLIAWAQPVRAAGIKIAYSPPTPYRNSGTLHSNYAAYTARRAALLDMVRDPAVWRQFADYYIPMGEHPDFNDQALIASLYGDNVHLNGPAADSAKGQYRLRSIFRAAMTTIRDASRATAAGPYASIWPANETGLAPNTEIVRRFILSGLRPDAPSSLHISDAQIRLNGGAWLDSIPIAYNGDVIDVRMTSSASSSTPVSYDLTIGGTTRTIILTTSAAVDPVTYSNAGIVSDPAPATVKNFASIPFGNGLAVLAITSQSSYATAVTIAGNAATLVYQQARSGTRGFQIWTCPVIAGSHNVTITRAASSSHHVMSYMTLANADPAPISQQGSAPANQSSPHNTALVTVPDKGIALAWLMEEGGASITPVSSVSAPASLIAEGNCSYQNATTGLALACRTSSGAVAFPFAFGTFARAVIVFKAAGT